METTTEQELRERIEELEYQLRHTAKGMNHAMTQWHIFEAKYEMLKEKCTCEHSD